ncbi:2-keto-4-pentenoate hydratase [Methylobacterium sp. JK268]
MPLVPSAIEAFGLHLAAARRAGAVATRLDLGRLANLEEAEAVAEAALHYFGGTPAGYVLAATNPLAARQLGCREPVAAPLLREALLPEGVRYRLPLGLIGAGAGFCLRLGRPFPVDGEPLTTERAAAACLSCHLDLHLLGRRVPGSPPLDERAATADLGLDVVHVLGPRVALGRDRDLAGAAVALAVDGNVLATGRGADSLGGPLAALVWLARRLAAQGRGLDAGDVVATGSCTALVQVLPGQRLRADFGGLGALTLATA